MKTLWHMTSFLAVVNFLVLLMFVGWLYQSGRLNRDRIEEIRELLAPTVAEAREAETDAAAVAASEERARIEQIREANPFPPSGEHVHFIERVRQQERDRMRRAETEMAALRSQLIQARRGLTEERAAFEAERDSWRLAQNADVDEASVRQFARVVGLLEQISPRQAKDMLVGLMRDDRTNEAVEYLNAMKPFNASEVVRSFKTDEQTLATELLQRMKALGGPDAAAGPSSNADGTDQSG